MAQLQVAVKVTSCSLNRAKGRETTAKASWRGGSEKWRTVRERPLEEKHMRGARTGKEKGAESRRWKKGRQAYEAPKGKDVRSDWVFPVAEETI